MRQLARFGFARKALTRIDHALVFSTRRGGYEAYLPPLRPTRGEAATKRFTSVYEVDMGVHPLQASVSLPSDNDAFEFTAAVDLSWQVTDPAAFVRSGHRDVPTLLLGEIQQAARSLTRRFVIDDSAGAEAALLRALTGPGRVELGTAVGLKVVWTMRLRRDQQDIEHEQRLQSIDHASAEQIRAEQLGMHYDVALDRRTRQQDELQLGRVKEYERLEHEIAIRRTHHETELRHLAAEKIALYQKYLEQGGVVMWAMHLAAHPEDTHLVINNMREDQLRLVQAQSELAQRLLSEGNAEDYELEGPKKLALNHVFEVFNQRLSGVPDGAPPMAAPLTVTPAAAEQEPAPAQEPAHTFQDWQPPHGDGRKSADA
ncbi:hypothetical protein GCM10010431_05840 [Streptomyces kunmingensis]